jgi:hypothetical protein
LVGLNHFTVPVVIVICLSGKNAHASTEARDQTFGWDWKGSELDQKIKLWRATDAKRIFD